MIVAVKKLGNIFIFIFLLFICVLTVFPLVYTVCASFKSNAEIMTASASLFPKEFTLDNYIQTLKSDSFPLPLLTFNSLYYTIICVMIAVMNSAIGGYVFSRGHFTGQKIIFAVFTSLMFVNLGGATTIPLLKIVNGVGLSGSLCGLIIIKVFGINIVSIYLVRSYVETIPKEIDEAATIDGCGFIRILFAMIIPLLKPVLATVALLSFQGSWNETIMPVIFTLSNPSQRTLSAGLYALKSSGGAAAQTNLMMAGSVVSMLPVIVAYAFANKYFVAGLSSGAVKG